MVVAFVYSLSIRLSQSPLILVVVPSTPALSLAFVAVNIRNLLLTLSAHKKNELSLWACLSLNVQHEQFEFRQVLDHNSLL